MRECPKCKSKGTVTIQSSTYKDGNFVQNDPVVIECITCNGKGGISEAQFNQIEVENRKWCDCDNPSESAVYWADDTHPECSKHHWRCGDCGKIQQVG